MCEWHLTSRCHVFMNSSGTPLWNTQEAPALRNAWKVKGGEIFRARDIGQLLVLFTQKIFSSSVVLIPSVNRQCLTGQFFSIK